MDLKKTLYMVCVWGSGYTNHVTYDFNNIVQININLKLNYTNSQI